MYGLSFVRRSASMSSIVTFGMFRLRADRDASAVTSRAPLSGVRLDSLLQHLPAVHARAGLDQDAVLEEEERGNPAHAVALGQRVIAVRVHLADEHARREL